MTTSPSENQLSQMPNYISFFLSNQHKILTQKKNTLKFSSGVDNKRLQKLIVLARIVARLNALLQASMHADVIKVYGVRQ